MASQAAVRTAQPVPPARSGRPHLLIVTDCPDRLRGLRASISPDGIEITAAISAEELHRACRSSHDLAVIDVSAARLMAVLRILRSSVRHRGISLLVEASRIVAEPGLAGLLPRYRAMPCSRSDLLKLAHCLTTGGARPVNNRTLL